MDKAATWQLRFLEPERPTEQFFTEAKMRQRAEKADADPKIREFVVDTWDASTLRWEPYEIHDEGWIGNLTEEEPRWKKGRR